MQSNIIYSEKLKISIKKYKDHLEKIKQERPKTKIIYFFLRNNFISQRNIIVWLYNNQWYLN